MFFGDFDRRASSIFCDVRSFCFSSHVAMAWPCQEFRAMIAAAEILENMLQIRTPT